MENTFAFVSLLFLFNVIIFTVPTNAGCNRAVAGYAIGRCQPSGTLKCNNGKYFPQFKCSPPVTSSTKALLTLKADVDVDGGVPSECDGKFHASSEHVVALSTGWYNDGSRCGKTIKITAKNGKSTTAKVVDECDSMNGCDKDHAGQPPCRNNVVEGTDAVWEALGLNKELGVVDITWSMA